MPLVPGKSKKVVSENISEFSKGPTFAKTKAKFGAKRAQKQAVAVAFSKSREKDHPVKGLAKGRGRKK